MITRVLLRGEHVYALGPRLTPLLAPLDRGVIRGFSQQSAARLRRYLHASEVEYTGMLTLTVPSWAHGSADASLQKERLRTFIKRLKRSDHWRAGQSVCWVMELHHGGWYHFHCLLNFFLPLEWVSRAWYEVVGTENPHHLAAGTRVETLRHEGAALKYVAKYISKGAMATQAGLAGKWCGRWWGVVGRRDTVEATLECREGQESLLSPTLLGKMSVLTEKGEAEMVDTSKWDCPNIVCAWRVPRKGVRRQLRAWLRGLRYTLALDYAGGACFSEAERADEVDEWWADLCLE